MITLQSVGAMLFMLMSTVPGFGESAPGSPTQVSTDSDPVVANGGTTARTAASRAADVVNVKDFGAIGDDTADDTAAINTAMAYARSHFTGGQQSPGILLPQGVYRVTSPLNFTGFDQFSVTIKADGATLDCQFSGSTACVDMLGSSFFRVDSLSIFGNPSFQPTYGLQIGRTGLAGAGGHEFYGLRVTGNFARAAVYEYASETNLWSHPVIQNLANGVVYAVIMDGVNYWHVTSTFQAVTALPNTPASFNENTFLSANFGVSSTTGSSIWMSGTSRHSYIGSYIGQNGKNAIVINSAFASNSMLNADIHIENRMVSHVFFITGSPTASFGGLSYRDHSSQIVGSVFGLDTGVTGVTITDFQLDVESFFSTTPVPTVFDRPSAFRVAGSVFIPADRYWATPSYFSGQLCMGLACIFVNQVLSPPTVSACGKSAGIQGYGNNYQGRIVIGPGTVSSCTFTFANAGFGHYVNCVVSPHAAIPGFGYSYTNSSITLTAPSLTLAIVDYVCMGN